MLLKIMLKSVLFTKDNFIKTFFTPKVYTGSHFHTGR